MFFAIPPVPGGWPAVRHGAEPFGSIPESPAGAPDVGALTGLDEATLRARILGAIPGVLVTVLDRELRIITMRSRLSPGEPPDEVPWLGQSVFDNVLPEHRSALDHELRAALRGAERRFRFTGSIRAPEMTFDLSAAPLRGRHEEIVGVVVAARDISQEVAADDREAALVRRYRGTLQNAALPLALIDTEGRLAEANTELCTLLGVERSALAQQPFLTLIDPGDRHRIAPHLASLLTGERGRLTLNLRLTSVGRPPVQCEVHFSGRIADDPESMVIVQIVDKTEKLRHAAELEYLASHDQLTGLANRAGLEDAITDQLLHCAEYGYRGAVVLAHIDQFKQFNDVYGRSAGDQQLIAVAQLLQATAPTDSLPGRIEGDEFGLLLPDASLSDAVEVANALLTGAHERATAMRAAGRRGFTLSVGAAVLSPETATAADVLFHGEHAVVAAKLAGRDRVSVPDVVPGPARLRAQTAIDRLRSALTEERFELHAQPIVPLGKPLVPAAPVSRYELLVRLRESDGELVPPHGFLPLAERYGLVGEIDAWVVRTALEALAPLDPPLTFQLNISGGSLDYPALLSEISDGLQDHAIAAERLVFELTETEAIASVTNARAFADRLRELGCELALDDFGAGFGGLHYLKHLPFSYLKIDGEFIQHLATDRTDQRIVDGILAITKAMGIRTVAEFVGDARCYERLEQLGVDYAQGYYVGRPEPLDALLQRTRPHAPPP